MKSALVLGGARGIGRVVASAFVSEGFGVTVAARTIAQVKATAKALSVKVKEWGFHS